MVGEVRALVAGLAGLEGADDVQRIDLISELESLKGAASAAQARLAVAFAKSQEAVQAAGGVAARERGRGVAAQVALARRESRIAGRGTWASRGRWSPRCPRRWLT